MHPLFLLALACHAIVALDTELTTDHVLSLRNMTSDASDQDTQPSFEEDDFPRPPSHVHWAVPSAEEAVCPDRATFQDPIWKVVEEMLEHGQLHDPKSNLYTIDDLLARQFPGECTRTLEVQIRTGEGLFSSLNQLAGAMAVALRLNRTFVSRGSPINYAPTEECKKEPWKGDYSWWNCLFMPMTNCTFHGNTITKAKKEQLEERVAHIFQHVNNFPEVIRHVHEIPPLTPAHVLHNANLMAFLFRPVEAYTSFASRVSGRLGLWGEAYATMHIRRTDKAKKEHTFGVDVYLDLLRRHLPEGTTKVFVMTDSAEVLGEIALATNSSSAFRGLRFVWMPQQRPREGASVLLNTNVGINAVQHTAEFFADIIIAMNSTLFIGSCTSHVGRTMIALVAMRAPGENRTVMVDEADCRRHAQRWFNFHMPANLKNIGSDLPPIDKQVETNRTTDLPR